jgi:hypothetical protein
MGELRLNLMIPDKTQINWIWRDFYQDPLLFPFFLVGKNLKLHKVVLHQGFGLFPFLQMLII